ncbi:MAG: hypothetical protein PHO29_01340 [Acetobacterium sp.]|nr:hypothetical protein [Acetobacterium sp.]
MKWLKDIKTTTRPWLTFLSRFAASTTDEPDDTAIINEYFATYLQNMAADRIKPVSCKTSLKQPEKSLRALSPLKQVL